ncbi:MAG TPA: FtsX-like permease family protein [Thermoanaerobaculia bacterium]|nr:FtsX-like permease family protein [Thermoanaerobaculia bacterium]
MPLLDSVVGDLRSTLWILLGAVGFVLLVAVANVANLFLVRAEEGQQPTAVRAALGAGRVRLLRGSLAESLTLALAAGAVGLALAGAAVAALRRMAPVEVPRLHEVRLDPTVAGVSLAACLAAALLFGLLPLLGGSRRPLAGRLRDAGRHATGGRRRVRGRNLLVAAQVALALVLLIAAGLMFRTFANLRGADLGFAHRQALTFEIALPEARYPSRAEARQLHRRLLERLAALPGVEAVGAVAQCLPLVPSMCWGETLQAEGRPTPEGQVPPVTGARIATPDYFRTLGIPLRGRPFTLADEEGAEPVAILSEAAAAAYFPGEEALGERITFGGDDAVWYRIVGVAGDVAARVGSDDFQRLVYLPLLPRGEDGTPALRLGYVLRTAVPPSSLAPAVRAALAELDPLVPLADVRTLDDRIDEALAPTAFTLALLAIAGGLALLLGTVGLYGVVAYAVSRRSGEIGVRLALGASGAAVVRMVLGQGGAVVLAGTAVGLLAALGLTRLMEAMLVGVSPTDPASFALLTLLLLAVAAGALWIPARRAARVSPSEALRND